MAKPKNPLLSLGARGTLADSLTFQKRGRGHIARVKPVPTDPKSPAQLAWRQIFRDAIDAWHALTAEEQEAWRGVCPGLTAYQCFIRSHLVYAPPPVLFYIGTEAIDRGSYMPPDYTVIGKDNPANATGTITSVEIWAYSELAGVVVGTFYTTNGNTLKCRDSEAIPGLITPGSKQTKTVSITVVTGDYIGMYYTGGAVERDTNGYADLWTLKEEQIDPGDEATYALWKGQAISLYGIGEQAA